MKSLRKRLVFVGVMAVSLIALIRVQQYYGTIYHGWDAQFYFALAHSLIFDRDTDVTNDLLMTPYPKPLDPSGDGSWSAAPRRADGRIPSKYPLGMSMVEAPFLAFGHLLRRAVELAGWEVSGAYGYSSIEIWSVAVGLQLLFGAGLAVLYSILKKEYGQSGATLGVLGCWLGTSLFYYSALFPFMAHAVSFVLLVLILYASRELTMEAPTVNSRLAWLGALLGALFLVRPQQVIIALFLIPIFVIRIRSRPAATWCLGACIGATFGLAAVATQLACNYSQFGVMSFSGYAVGGEGFSWLHPQLSFVLFSPSRGLFVFSPVIAIALIGYFLFPRFIPMYVYPMIGNAVLQIYLVAAWSSPEQGDAFGARMWSDNAAVVAIGLAIAFNRLGTIGQSILTVATVVAIGWTIYLLGRFVGVYP